MTTTLLKHNAPQILPEDPYKECYTGRKAVGKSLTSIINSLELGGTIALTGEWGSGKTTFLNMWRQDLINQGFPTVSLNAWETEWADDPLIAVIACIYSACNEDSLSEKQKINDKLKRLLKKPLPILGAIATSLAEAALNVDVKSVIEKCKDISSQAFDDEVDSFTERASAMQELKKTLESLAWRVNQGETDNPLVFIIDELDRCKPDYSVRTLEVLKHIFEVKNIIFVCAIDKKHLEDSIRGYYGCESFDSSEYLRRFFHLEIELPKPNYRQFCTHLYSYYGLDDFFDSDERASVDIFKYDGKSFRDFFASLAERSTMSLRQVERIFAYTKLTLAKQNKRIYYYPELSLFVTFLRFFHYSFYCEIRAHKYSVQDLFDRLTSLVGRLVDGEHHEPGLHSNYQAMLEVFVELLVFYNNDYYYRVEDIYDSSTKSTPLTNDLFSNKDLVSTLERVVYLSSRSNYELKYLFGVLDILKVEDSNE